jgi:hypothetical protein
MDNARCVCQQGDQTIDHLLYDCNLLEAQRRILRKSVTKNGQWPADKHELITNHLEPLVTYIEPIDFNQLQQIKNHTEYSIMLELINQREKCPIVNNRNYSEDQIRTIQLISYCEV